MKRIVVSTLLIFSCLSAEMALAQQERVFVTSTVHAGDMGGLAGGDAICEQRASEGGLAGGTWIASLSTETLDAVESPVLLDENGAASPANAPSTGTRKLLVGAANGQSVKAFDASDGAALGDFTSGAPHMSGAHSLAIGGPSEHLFVGGWSTRRIDEFDPDTGQFIRTLVDDSGFDYSSTIAFGPDGHLYVTDASGGISRWNVATGTLIGSFVAAGSGGLQAIGGMRFGPDGNLYVGSLSGVHDGRARSRAQTRHSRVLRFDGATGAPIDTFVANGSGGLRGPDDLTFGPDGDLYVSSRSTDNVLRFDGETGSFVEVFAAGGGLNTPQGLVFGPDGNLYVTSGSTRQILRFDGETGDFIDVFATGTNPNPTFILFTEPDTDRDGIADSIDNCVSTPNGPNGGSCNARVDASSAGDPCTVDAECGPTGECSMDQEDLDQDGVGDACELAPNATRFIDGQANDIVAVYRWKTCESCEFPDDYCDANSSCDPPDPLPTEGGLCIVDSIQQEHDEATVTVSYSHPTWSPPGVACCAWEAFALNEVGSSSCTHGERCYGFLEPGGPCINSLCQDGFSDCTTEADCYSGVCCHFAWRNVVFSWGGAAPGTDADGDRFPQACDNCPAVYNEYQIDSDLDGCGDDCDNDRLEFNPDSDLDGCGDDCDNDPLQSDPVNCPEPGGYAMLAAGVALLAALRRRRDLELERAARPVSR